MLHTVSVGVHSSLNNPLVLSSACSPCMKSVFAAGFMRKLGGKGYN